VIFFAGSHTSHSQGQGGGSCSECKKLVAKGALCEHHRRLASRENSMSQLAPGRARFCSQQADSDEMDEGIGENDVSIFDLFPRSTFETLFFQTEVPETATRKPRDFIASVLRETRTLRNVQGHQDSCGIG